MTEFVCSKFEDSIAILEEALSLDSVEEIIIKISLAYNDLLSTYSPLKDDVYYANKICKNLYCIVRENRSKALHDLECALELNQDKGDKCCLKKEIKQLISESIPFICKAKNDLCLDCSCDSCETHSNSSSSSSSCDSSSSSSSCCDSSSSSSSSCSSSCSSSSSDSSISSSSDSSSCCSTSSSSSLSDSSISSSSDSLCC